MKNYIDTHHICPVSLKGYNIEENKIMLLRNCHEQIHKALDNRMLYTVTRKAKEKTNHKLYMTADDLNYRHDAQRLYFSWINKLPEDIIDIHTQKLNELIKYESNRLQPLARHQKQEYIDNFDDALLCYHIYWGEIAKVMEKVIKKWLSSFIQ